MAAALVYRSASGLISHTLLRVHTQRPPFYAAHLTVNRKVYYGSFSPIERRVGIIVRSDVTRGARPGKKFNRYGARSRRRYKLPPRATRMCVTGRIRTRRWITISFIVNRDEINHSQISCKRLSVSSLQMFETKSYTSQSLSKRIGVFSAWKTPAKTIPFTVRGCFFFFFDFAKFYPFRP